LDSAANNDTAMVELSRILLEEQEFFFNPVDRHIHCFPHIYNLCVQCMLDKYTHTDFSQCPQMWNNSAGVVIYRDSYTKTVCNNPIGQGRDIIHTICSSSLHHLNFRQTLISGNEQEWFTNDKGNIIMLPVVQLLHNVKTHWDSTYYMINCLHALQQVSIYDILDF
ncbi:hypothetical protein PAXRUDRAFT_157343, partial [Paxillus rubicundulus Ve08.2h10]